MLLFNGPSFQIDTWQVRLEVERLRGGKKKVKCVERTITRDPQAEAGW
jgi:hypothetical protein